MTRPLHLALTVVALFAGLTSTASAESRYVAINGVLSPYLGRLIDRPAAASDAALAARTNAKLARIARRAPRACRSTLGRVERVIANLRLGAKLKRTRILDAAAPTYYRC